MAINGKKHSAYKQTPNSPQVMIKLRLNNNQRSCPQHTFIKIIMIIISMMITVIINLRNIRDSFSIKINNTA